jgi:5-methylcytosine-specific restriction endonuclease McrA
VKGQVFTVAKLHYINGVVYFVAQEESTDLTTLAKHSTETTKSGNVKHPKVRVRTLVRFAHGLGLVERPNKDTVRITQLGRDYYESRLKDKWSLSSNQRGILRSHVLSDQAQSPTTHSIVSLLSLVKRGYKGKELAHQYAIAIGKQDAWKSDVTYDGFTNFGLNYLKELEFINENLTVRSFTTNHPTLNINELIKDETKEIARSRKDTSEARRKRIANAEQRPPRLRVYSYTYRRNTDIVVEALSRSNGVCEACGNPAPFTRSSDGTPFLEVHHVKSLSDGGTDTLDNVLALCPNCHRRKHYG